MAKIWCCRIILYCYYHCLWGFCVWSLFWYAVLSGLSLFCNYLEDEEKASCFGIPHYVGTRRQV